MVAAKLRTFSESTKFFNKNFSNSVFLRILNIPLPQEDNFDFLLKKLFVFYENILTKYLHNSKNCCTFVPLK